MSYIARSSNRFYAALESVYGNATAVSAANRIIAGELKTQQMTPPSQRRDKTGSRTYSPAPVAGLRTTAYQLRSYLTSLAADGSAPCGTLFAAGCGAPPLVSSGLSVAAAAGTSLQTTSPHGLTIGSGVSYGGELRFVAAVSNATAVQLNAPFSKSIAAGSGLGTTTTFALGRQLAGVTLYDYWDPSDAVSSIVTGAVVDKITVSIKGDKHELSFDGRAADLLDSTTFTAGRGGLASFPAEPTLSAMSYSVVPGELGQAWLGAGLAQFFTLTEAQVTIQNNIALRETDLGGQVRAIVPGARRIAANFTLLAQDDEQTKSLYQVAKQRGTISVLLQMGQQNGRMMAVYLPAVRPDIPVFDDSSERLAWRFHNNAEGTNDDELYFAFG